jgi:hypothetical protein
MHFRGRLITTYAIRKFQSQLLAVLRAIAFARYLLGYSSPQIAHTIGPHVVANPKMKKHAKHIKRMDACSVFWGFSESRENAPTEANIMKQMNIHAEPAIRDLRLP